VSTPPVPFGPWPPWSEAREVSSWLCGWCVANIELAIANKRLEFTLCEPCSTRFGIVPLLANPKEEER
jgi:hypothetical protein